MGCCAAATSSWLLLPHWRSPRKWKRDGAKPFLALTLTDTTQIAALTHDMRDSRSKFDLMLQKKTVMQAALNSIDARLQYDKELGDASTVERQRIHDMASRIEIALGVLASVLMLVGGVHDHPQP